MKYQSIVFGLSLALGGCALEAGNASDDGERLGEADQALCPGAPMKASGYVWADQPVSAAYTPNPGYQFNSSGGVNSIVRTGVGVYGVKFPGLSGGGGLGGVVHVTAYGGAAESCKVSSWGPMGNDVVAQILCFDGNGAPIDTKYDVSFSTAPTEVVNHGYVWADDATAASYIPNTIYQFNSTCATNSVTRTGVGKYTVKFPGLAAPPLDPQPGGTVKVTAYGPGSEMCKVEAWSANSGTELVDVRCYTATGAATDTQFTATYTRANNLFGMASGNFGYVRGDLPSSAAYTPVFSDQFNSTGATNTITHGGVAGYYTVKFPGLGTSGGHAQVSGAGLGSGRCKVESWLQAGADEKVNVRCYTKFNVPADTQFTLSFYQP